MDGDVCSKRASVLRRMAALWLFNEISLTLGMVPGTELRLSCVSCRTACGSLTEATSFRVGLTYT